MIYELRVYKCAPGRLPDLVNRFATHAVKMWEKHAIRQVGFWTTLIGESGYSLTYMLAWESLAERETKWTTFISDPEWNAIRAETEKNGPLMTDSSSSFLQPAAFSNLP